MALRRWANWANRLWTVPPVVEVEPRVVPVSLVDDSRALSLPPLRTIYGISEVIAGVVGEHSQIVLAPGTNKVLRVLQLRCTATGDIFGTTRQIYPPVGSDPIPTLTAAWSWPGTNYLQSGQDQQACAITGGTNTADVFDGDAAMRFRTGVAYDFTGFGGIHVLPTEVFVLQTTGTNVTVTLDHIIFEVCDVDYREEALFQPRR